MTNVTGVPTKQIPYFENSRLMAIAINATNYNLIWRAQDKPNGQWVADWAWVNNANQYDAMVAGVARDGSVVVLGQAKPSPAVQFFVEAPGSTGNNVKWEGPVNLGLPPGVPSFSQLVTTRGGNGKVNVFGLAKDTAMSGGSIRTRIALSRRPSRSRRRAPRSRSRSPCRSRLRR